MQESWDLFKVILSDNGLACFEALPLSYCLSLDPLIKPLPRVAKLGDYVLINRNNRKWYQIGIANDDSGDKRELSKASAI